MNIELPVDATVYPRLHASGITRQSSSYLMEIALRISLGETSFRQETNARPLVIARRVDVKAKEHAVVLRFVLCLCLFLLSLLTGVRPGASLGSWFGSDLPAVAYRRSAGRRPRRDMGTRTSRGNDPVRISPTERGREFSALVTRAALPGLGLQRATNAELVVYEAETGQTDTLVSGVEDTQPPIWSPESDRIAYVSDADGDS